MTTGGLQVFASRYPPKRNEKMCLPKDLYMNMCSHFIYNSQNLQTAQMSNDRCIENKLTFGGASGEETDGKKR